jgi:DNA-binding PadR family transcriptional regulator
MTPPALSDIELTLLGIVATSPHYGGEIERLIAARGVREWLMVGSASAYYVLSRLEEQGLIVSRRTDAERDQRVFQITEAGRGVLQTAVIDLLSRRRSLDGFSLGLANLHVLRPSQALRALVDQQKALAAAISQLQAARDALPADADLAVRALLDHQLVVARAEQTWLHDFISTWRAAHPNVRDTEEAQTSTAAPAQTAPDDLAAQTLVHRRTEVHRHKRIQSIKRPDSAQGGTTE